LILALIHIIQSKGAKVEQRTGNGILVHCKGSKDKNWSMDYEI